MHIWRFFGICIVFRGCLDLILVFSYPLSFLAIRLSVIIYVLFLLEILLIIIKSS